MYGKHYSGSEIARMAQVFRVAAQRSLHRRFESHCGTWVPVLRIKLYNPRYRVAAGVACIRNPTAQSRAYRSKFPAVTGNGDSRRIAENSSCGYNITDRQITEVRCYKCTHLVVHGAPWGQTVSWRTSCVARGGLKNKYTWFYNISGFINTYTIFIIYQVL
jgi:hypothetical protein